MRVRIVSPRWDHSSNRWMMPGEEIDIRPEQWDTEPNYFMTHAVKVPAPTAPQATLEEAPALEPTDDPTVPTVRSAPSDKMSRARRTK